ncbi:MAG: endonuclease domain-containing protein [Bacteroidota bacterium]
MKWPEIKEIATRLRNNPTPSEVALWQILRNKQLMGRKFLRQHPVIYNSDRNKNEFFFFVPDFYCAREKLVIELDGLIHDFQKEKDYRRDMILVAQNLRVLRISNDDLVDMNKIKVRISSMFHE